MSLVYRDGCPCSSSHRVHALTRCCHADAVVATDLFRDRSEFFFDFSQSLYSLFQIATGDAWSSQIVRPLMDEYDSGSVYKGWTALFFVSYVLVVGVVLMNIVVAVLLDEFISTVAAEKANARAEEQEMRDKEKVVNSIAEGPLDALVRSLLAYTTKDDLHRRIFNLYQRVDLDQSGNLAGASPNRHCVLGTGDCMQPVIRNRSVRV